MNRIPPDTSVDRPCDVHYIECKARGLREAPHCAEWDRVAKFERRGVKLMDCPQPGCAPTEEDIDRKCGLSSWGANKSQHKHDPLAGIRTNRCEMFSMRDAFVRMVNNLNHLVAEDEDKAEAARYGASLWPIPAEGVGK